MIALNMFLVNQNVLIDIMNLMIIKLDNPELDSLLKCNLTVMCQVSSQLVAAGKIQDPKTCLTDILLLSVSPNIS